MDIASIGISVVIPLFNGKMFIIEALDSVRTQTVAPLEILVIDDGSTDEGPELVEKYAGSSNVSIRMLYQANGGQSSARNYGISQANGDLIALLDQDDVWYPDHIEALVKPFTSSEQVGLSYSNLDVINVEGGVVIKSALDHLESPQPKATLTDCLYANMYILPSASLMSKRAWEEVGGFDERLSGYEDDDLFIRIWECYEVSYVDRPLSQWRIQPVSSSWTPKMWESGLVYAEKLIAQYPDDPSLQQYYVRDYIAPRFFKYYLSVYNSLLEKDDLENVARVHGAIERFAQLMKPSLEVSGILFLARYPKLFSSAYGIARGLRRLSSRGRKQFR